MMNLTLNSKPWMDAAGLDYFESALNNSRCYLEYGCGGSTVVACHVAKIPVVISTESDNSWTALVKNTLVDYRNNLFLEHCDIGEVSDWGVPTNIEKIADFHRYSSSPWIRARKLNVIPDLVLIDGRFRVASFLFSLISARIDTTIMFDDYIERPEYFVVENFCDLFEIKGRMAIFKVQKNFSFTEIAEKLTQYSVIYD